MCRVLSLLRASRKVIELFTVIEEVLLSSRVWSLERTEKQMLWKENSALASKDRASCSCSYTPICQILETTTTNIAKPEFQQRLNFHSRISFFYTTMRHQLHFLAGIPQFPGYKITGNESFAQNWAINPTFRPFTLCIVYGVYAGWHLNRMPCRHIQRGSNTTCCAAEMNNHLKMSSNSCPGILILHEKNGALVDVLYQYGKRKTGRATYHIEPYTVTL